MAIATVAAVATVAAAGATVYGQLKSNSAQNSAAGAAQSAQDQNLMQQQNYAQQTRDANIPIINAATQQAQGYMMPYTDIGNRARNALEAQLGLMTDANGQIVNTLGRQFTAQDYQNSPNYTPLTSNQLTQQQYTQSQVPNGAPALVGNTLSANQWKNDGTGTYTATPTTLEQLQQTPGYQFQLQQGEQAINNSAAAKGNLLSGASLAAANNYAQGQAGTYFQQAWNNGQQAYQNAFNRQQTNFQQGQTGYQNAFNNQQTQYNQGQTAYNNAQQNFAQNQQQNYNMLAGLNSAGQNAAGSMGNYAIAGANAIANQNSNAAQMGSTASNNYANNTGSLAIAQGQNQANMYTNMGNQVTGLVGKYLASNNTGLDGSTTGSGGGSGSGGSSGGN
jgi:hypothetical protein